MYVVRVTISLAFYLRAMCDLQCRKVKLQKAGWYCGIEEAEIDVGNYYDIEICEQSTREGELHRKGNAGMCREALRSLWAVCSTVRVQERATLWPRRGSCWEQGAE